MGGYDPVVRRLLARAERKGAEMGSKKKVRDDGLIESEGGDSDSGSDSYSSSEEFDRTVSSFRRKDRGQRENEIDEAIEICLTFLNVCTSNSR